VFRNILIVCVGNICRSPIGEYLMRERALEAGQDAVRVSSAGLGALVDHGAEPNAVQVAAGLGLDLGPHKARQLDDAMLRESDLVLVMERWQQQEIERKYPFARGRVHLLGKWNELEIEDPYKKPLPFFEKTCDDIEECIGLWCEKLWKTV